MTRWWRGHGNRSGRGGATQTGGQGPKRRIDRRIIEQLQKDGRKPYTQIAPAVGLSEAAVRQRVQRLIDGGVMQIVAVTDPRLLGFTRQAMIGLKIEGDTRRVAEAVADLHEVEYVVLTAGALDMLIEVAVEDDEGLLELLNEKIRKIDGVRTTETDIYLRIHKETYQWGTAPAGRGTRPKTKT